MAELLHFSPRHELDARKNLEDFILFARDELTTFGFDLDWDKNYWPTAGVAFGNLDQKSRKLDPGKVMRAPFLAFAKAYLRYQQSIKPTKNKQEMPALKCLERALIVTNDVPALKDMNAAVLDLAATLAREQFFPGQAYHAGRQLERLARFVSEKHLVAGQLLWKSPNTRPGDTVRTGEKAKEQREKKLPDKYAVDAMARIFASNPTSTRDVFTTSVSAMLLCTPSRITEVLSLPVDCEYWGKKHDGTDGFGWRFRPGKGAKPGIKWVPDVMADLAQEAIRRVRELTEEARRIAAWYEANPGKFYRHDDCPNVAEDAPLSVMEVAAALGIGQKFPSGVRAELRRFGLPDQDGANTLAGLGEWVQARLPKEFPWFNKAHGLKYSEALFCMQDKQLRSDMPASPFMVWKPTNNRYNDDLTNREATPGTLTQSIFDRHGFNDGRESLLKMTSHQFRHQLNTMAQRGGLSQSELARWSGRADVKQNRVYDHMSEFDLVAMLRSHDPSLTLERSYQEIAEQVATLLPITSQEFNSLAIPNAHVTECGYCVHDFVMSPCQRFRDCLNCTEQVCIKGDHRIDRMKLRLEQVQALKARAEQEIEDGSYGADRWFEIHDLTEKRLRELIGIMEDPAIEPGAIIRLRNQNEFSPWRRAVESKAAAGQISAKDRDLLTGMRNLLEGGDGQASE